MYLSFALLIAIISNLRKTLKTNGFSAQLDKLLLAGLGVSIALVTLGSTVKSTSAIVQWCLAALLLYSVYFIFKHKEFQPSRPMLFAMLPLIVISLIGDIVEAVSEEFYKEWDNYFETAGLFAFIWMGAYWFITRRQRKALEQERLKAEAKEKEYRITEKLKAELEVQVAERTAALQAQTEELQKTIVELKATQTQLIQAEKMASLGELTAGIAHEIQNPLNFVNNFSEVSAELIDEMNAELAKGDMEEVKAISNDLKQNLEKINHHGKRADAIVKGMLQHSRSSSGQKESTDINALCDEYLRLSYHGLRAKDKSFNAKFETNLDATLPKVNVVPQDMGRVILNLINNAFYAVSEKQKTTKDQYDPKVTISTKLVTPHQIEIRVADNGNGIPERIKDKIFQPFFTTKPTGQGTGLGLSLSYDIVTKGHGGTLQVETQEGVGTTFIIIFALS